MNRKSKKAGIIFLAGVAISAVPFFLNVEEKARTDSYIESFMEGSNEDTGKHNKKKNTEKYPVKKHRRRAKLLPYLKSRH